MVDLGLYYLTCSRPSARGRCGRKNALYGVYGNMAEIKTHEGHLNAAGKRFALVVSRFNEFFSSKLLAGAEDCLLRHGAA